MRAIDLDRRSADGLGLRLVVETTDVETHELLSESEAARHPRAHAAGVEALVAICEVLDAIVRDYRSRV